MKGDVEAGGKRDAKWPGLLRLLFIAGASLALWGLAILLIFHVSAG